MSGRVGCVKALDNNGHKSYSENGMTFCVARDTGTTPEYHYSWGKLEEKFRNRQNLKGYIMSSGALLSGETKRHTTLSSDM
ncbi:hypothetical protein K493DRAFT_359483 [Basidiobolus meristosporus CBS 931.73]|uniref:Uncharacterized protein n=1 Tax=Basidiobolus meristosporus CBS 931.73 TaxID=1314790 RepID=A0A1Y1XRX4_9FUNG|nr:hypothetical protein K493DRAFT_359483 [Basidiobolus meristosporus CBS 931.73]|eukprot:ORX88500.1 hypothetical protein K493DRAFT_359483 [Basidiobolus meristosporus CBS 931.73]